MRWIVFGLALVACDNKTQDNKPPGYLAPSGELLLTVNGHKITSDMMEASTRLTPESEIERQKRSGAWVKRVEQVGLGEVLYHDALDKGLDKEPGVKNSIQMAVREVLAQENFARQVESKITDGTVQKYYEDRAVQYKRPQVHARHILVREEAKAKDLIAQLEKGADFYALAKEHTLDEATKDKGGDLGFFERKMLDPNIAKIAFEGEVAKPLGPIETRFGFHVFEVLERRDMVPLSEVREEIENKMRQEQAQLLLDQLKANLKMERHGELEEIYKKTADWGTEANPMGKTPPPARPDADPNLPGVRMGADAEDDGHGHAGGGAPHGGGGPHGGN